MKQKLAVRAASQLSAFYETRRFLTVLARASVHILGPVSIVHTHKPSFPADIS